MISSAVNARTVPALCRRCDESLYVQLSRNAASAAAAAKYTFGSPYSRRGRRYFLCVKESCETWSETTSRSETWASKFFETSRRPSRNKKPKHSRASAGARRRSQSWVTSQYSENAVFAAAHKTHRGRTVDVHVSLDTEYFRCDRNTTGNALKYLSALNAATRFAFSSPLASPAARRLSARRPPSRTCRRHCASRIAEGNASTSGTCHDVEPHAPNRASRSRANIAAGPARVAHAERSASLSVFASEHSTSARKKSANETGRRHGVRHLSIVRRRNRLVCGYQRSSGAQRIRTGTKYVAAAQTCAAIKPRVGFFSAASDQDVSYASSFARRKKAVTLARYASVHVCATPQTRACVRCARASSSWNTASGCGSKRQRCHRKRFAPHSQTAAIRMAGAW